MHERKRQSRHVDEISFVSVVALHVVLVYEHFDLLFDHLRVCFKHSDVTHDISKQILEAVLLLCFHNLDDMSLYYECALLSNLFLLILFFLRSFCCLLLHNLLWDQVRTDLAGLVARVHLDFLLLAKHWFVNFFF